MSNPQLQAFVHELAAVAETPKERELAFQLSRWLRGKKCVVPFCALVERMKKTDTMPFGYLESRKDLSISDAELDVAENVITALNGGFAKVTIRPAAKAPAQGDSGLKVAERSAKFVMGYRAPKGVPCPNVPRRTGADLLRDWVFGMDGQAMFSTHATMEKFNMQSGTASGSLAQLKTDGILQHLKHGKWKKRAQADAVITRMWKKRAKTAKKIAAKS